MRFLIFVIDDNNALAGPDEMAMIDAFNDKLREGGHWLLAGGLHSPKESIVIDNRGGAGDSTSGSLFTEVEHYSGFWLIQADDPATAEALATEGSLACNRKVELRQLHF